MKQDTIIDNHSTYDVYKTTNSFITSKSICGLKKIETAYKRFNKYCNELVLVYINRYKGIATF